MSHNCDDPAAPECIEDTTPGSAGVASRVLQVVVAPVVWDVFPSGALDALQCGCVFSFTNRNSVPHGRTGHSKDQPSGRTTRVDGSAAGCSSARRKRDSHSRAPLPFAAISGT